MTSSKSLPMFCVAPWDRGDNPSSDHCAHCGGEEHQTTPDDRGSDGLRHVGELKTFAVLNTLQNTCSYVDLCASCHADWMNDEFAEATYAPVDHS